MSLLHDYNFSKISSTEYIRNIFNSESNCFHYLFPKKIVFLKNIYVIIMSEDTPECAKLQIKKKSFHGNMPPNPLAMCFKIRRPQIPPKMIPQ